MITSMSNNRVKQVVSLQQKAKERKERKCFVIEGLRLFEEAPVELLQEVYVSEQYLDKVKDLEVLKKLPYEVVSADVFQRMSDTKTPQGILAVVKMPEYTMEEILAVEDPLLVLLEDIQDPGNVGTMMRTSEGAGVNGVVMTRETVDLFNPKTVRSTMGSIFRVPFLYVDDMIQTIRLLHEKKIRTYAAHLKGEKFYDELSYTSGCAFVIGNEGNGLKKETADAADTYLKIPMQGRLESLNAAVATALLVYEAARQRRKV